jgi:hypothetical protein
MDEDIKIDDRIHPYKGCLHCQRISPDSEAENAGPGWAPDNSPEQAKRSSGYQATGSKPRQGRKSFIFNIFLSPLRGTANDFLYRGLRAARLPPAVME